MITGKVIDAKTGAPLYAANVYISDANGTFIDGSQGAITDFDGNFQLDAHGFFVTASFVGYSKQTKPGQPIQVNFALDPGIDMEAVEIVARRPFMASYGPQLAIGLGLVIAIVLFIKYS